VILHNPFVLRDFRGTCSFVEILKGYVVRERMGTPALQHINSENSELNPTQ